MSDGARGATEPFGTTGGTRRTALLVVLTLVIGLLGATGLTPVAPAAAAAPGLVGRWAFDAGSGSTAVDSVGGKTATLASGAGWASGVQGASALTTNGTTGAAVTGGTVVNTSTSFTVSAYVKLNALSTSTNQTVVSQDGSAISGFLLQLRGDTLGVSKLATDSSSATTAVAIASTKAVVGQWYHIATVYDSTANTLAFYQNGRLQQTVASNSRWNATGNLAIGRAKFNGVNTDWLNGTTDDVRVYSQALSADDISHISEAAHWNLDEGAGTAAADDSLNQFTGTLTNGPTWVPGVIGPSSVNFDGSNDYIDGGAPVLDTSKSFSVSAWARTAQLGSPRVIASADGTNYSAFTLAITSTGQWAFTRAASNVASPSITAVQSSAAATVGTWYHLTGVYDNVAGTLTLYVDGTKQGSPVSYTTGWKATGDFIVGRVRAAAASAGYFSGAIDDVRVFPYVVDDATATVLADPPPPPVPATPTATLSGTTVNLSWVAPAPISGSPTTGFVVTPYVNGTAGNPQTFGTATSQSFTGATAGNSYRYTVAAINANGTSGASGQSVAVVFDVPGAPTITAASASDPTTASLTWSAPSSNGGSAVTGYRVTLYTGATAQATRTFGSASTGTAQSVTGLTPGTTYTFRVAAQNAAGYGSDSAASSAVTTAAAAPATMAAPTATAGATSASVSWTAPAANGSAITGYVVTPYIGTTAQTATSFAGSTATVQQITGLSAGTAYTFTLSAINAIGTGMASPKSNAVTVFAFPGAPAVTTVAAATQGASLTWSAPASNGGSALTGYRVTPYLSGVAQTTLTYPSSAAGASQSFPGLIAGKSYTFTVAAQNAGGYGAESATSTAVTPAAQGPANAPPQSTVGGAYSFQFTATGFTAPTTYAAIDGSLPPGLTLSSSGLLSGTPTVAGTYVWTVRVNDVANDVLSRTVTQVVAAAPVVSFTPATAVLNTAYSAQPTVAGGSTPFTWTVPVGALPAGLSMSLTTGQISGTPTAAGSFPITVRATDANGAQADRAVTLVVSTIPGTPEAPTASAGPTSAVVTWVAPVANGSAISGYVVTPYLAGGAQTAVTFDASTTTRTLTGLTAGGSYTFTVAAVNANGNGPASSRSPAVVVYDLPSAPSIIAVTAGSGRATLSWTTPANNGSPIIGFIVTPYNGSVAQSATTFAGTATTQTVTGLTAGTAYTFRVAAQNAAGTGPQSAPSTAVTPNANPTLTFTSVPAGEVGVAYSSQLPVAGGTAPFTWSVTSGTLPAGVSLSTAGLLAGTPTSGGTSTYTVQVTDASGQSASRSVSQLIAAAPSLAFSPAPGEVNVAYSQQPVLTGGTSPFTWSISAGSLPGGLSIDTSTGLVSGTPTASGTFSVTLGALDGFNQVATRTANLVIAPLPTLTSTPPKQYQQASFEFAFAATGGTSPFTYAVVSGSLPPGLSLSSAGGLTGQTNQGSYPFSVRATDAKGQTADDAVSLIVDAPPVQLVKTASATSVAPGGTVTFTLTATNISNTYYGKTHVYDPLADVLDDATYNSNASASLGSVSFSGSTLDWAIPLDGGQSATLTYTVTVTNPDTGNKLLTGQVDGVFSSTSCSSGQRTSACTAAVTVSGLSVSTTANAATTTPGSVVTFTTVVTNTGQTTYAAATFNQSLAAMLDDATYNGGATTTAGSLGYTSSTLTWTGALAVGASATITYTVTVSNPDTGDRSLPVTAVSSTAGSTCPSGNPGPACSATVTVLIPALSITHTSSVTTTTPGGSVAYTIVLVNTGQTPYTATSVSLDLTGVLDDGVLSVGSSTSGSLSYSNGTSVWTGDIAVGATVTISGSVIVAEPDTGDRVLTTVVTSAAAASTCPVGGTSSACRTTVPVLVPALSITASSDVTTTTPGSVVRYGVLVTNTGQTPYTGAAFSTSLAAVLDDATYNGDATASVGSASYAGSTLSWTGDLAVGASATISYGVTVRAPDPGNLSLTSTVVSTTSANNCPSGSTDAGCTVTVPVLIPSLTLSTVVDAGATTTPGATVRYTTTVLNSGQTTYTGAVVVLDRRGALDDATFNLDGVESSGTTTPQPDGTLRWVLTLAPGQSATATASFQVNDPATGNQKLTTNVTSSAPGSSCPTATAAASCQTSVDVLIPSLTLSTSASPTSVTPGDVVVYTISVTNTGETAYGSVTVTDDLTSVLGDAVYAGGASASSGGTPTFSGSTLSWTGSLALGATTTITFSVTVRDPDPGNKLLVNTVVSGAAGSNCAAGSSDPRCSSAVSVLVPGLTITNTANAATTTPGAVVSYTIKVTNSGATAFTGAAFSDPLGGMLDDASYNGDGGVASGGGTVSYASSTLSWSGPLAVGASTTVTYSVTVHAADGGNNLLASTVTSPSRGNICPIGSTDPRCTATVPVARLVLIQTATESTATPGSVVHLSTTWTNTGQVPYTGISIISPRSDTSDDTTPTGDQTTSSGTLVRTSDAVTWTGDIGIGGVVTGTRTLLVKDPDPANKLVTATLRSTAPGNNCPVGTTDQRCTFAVSVLVPGLTISKVANITTTVPGGTVSYTITARNTGQTSYPAAVLNDALAGVLDDATYNGDVSASTGSVSYAAPTLSWTGALAVDQTVTLTYSVRVKGQPGDKTMVNPVTSDVVGNNCPAASADPACRSTVVVLTPGLTLVKTADVANATLGSTVTYTVRATNSGQTAYASASFSDSLAGVLDDATYNGDAATIPAGTVGYAGSTLSWSGALAPGASATLTYSVTLHTPASGDRNLTNTVVSTSVGNNCPAGGSDSRCTALVAVTNAVSLTLTKTADVLITAAGRTVTYTVTAVNSSALTIAANFSDPLADIVDDATYDADAAASSGSVSLVSSTLGWAGNVGAGSTVTLTYSVTVHTTATGDQLLTGALVSTSPVASNSCLAGNTDPRCTSTVPVAALVIQQAYSEPTTTPGSLLHLSATFTNTGQADYNGISISSPSAGTLDDAVPTGDQVATSGSLALSATAITWTGDIPVGGSVSVTGTVTVLNPDLGDKQVTGTVVSAALGNNCPAGGTDPRCTALSVVHVPQLSITTTADKTVVVPGEQVGNTVVIHNTGETSYTGAIVTDSLAGLLDDAAYDGNAVASSGAVVLTEAPGNQGLTWTGDLAVGQSVTVTFSVTARQPATGDKSMVTRVASTAVGSTCLPGATASVCSSSVDVLTPVLTLNTAADRSTAPPGAIVNFSVTVTNAGQTDYPAGTQIVLPLDGVDDDAAYAGATSSSGAVALAGGVLTWTGGVSLGATVTISYSVTVDDPVTGDHLLQASARSDAQGSNCAPGSTDPRCSTVVPVASLHMSDATDVSVTQPLGVVHFTETYTNTGQVPFYGLHVTVDTRDAADDATYNGDGATTAGSLAVDTSTGVLTWTGDLPVGASVISTGSSTVVNPDPGNKRLRTRISTMEAPSNCAPDSNDPVCVIDIRVLTPGLSIVQAADTATTTPGSSVGYTLTITNSGETTVTGASVTADLAGVLDDAQGPTGAQASSGQLSPSGTTLGWTGDLSVGASATITYSVRVRTPDRGDLTLVDRVTSEDVGSSCPAGGSGSSCSTLVTVLIPALDLAVAPSTSTTFPGGQVGYTLTIHNSGQAPYAGATVTAALAGVLDDGTYFGDGQVNVGAVGFGEGALTWTGDLAVDQTATVTYSVTVSDPDPGNRLLLTSVSSVAPGSTCTTDQPCTSSVVVQIPGLSISTTADVATATPGSRVRFTITMINTGERTYVGTVTTASLADVLDDASFNGVVTASSGLASYTAPDLSWTGNLAVGGQATISYTVTVRDSDPGNKVMSTTAQNASAGSPCQADRTSPACTATVQVLIPSLAVSVSSAQATTTPGSVVDYTIRVTNDGQAPYSGAVVTDDLSGVLPDADYNGDALVDGGGVLAYGSGALTWTGDLPVGATATINFSATVHDPDTGDRVLLSKVSSDAAGSRCPSGSTASACISRVQVLVPGLLVSITADTAIVVAGSAVHYTVTLQNTGETAYTPATASWSLADLLDDGSYPGDAVPTSGTVERSGDTLVWSGPLPLGATVTITYSVNTAFPAIGDRSLYTAVRSTSPGSTCLAGTEAGCATHTSLLVPALTVTKTASTTHVVTRGKVSYTLTAKNTGEARYPAASLVDSLGGVLDDATYAGDATASTGTVGVADGSLTWTGSLGIGVSVVITYSVVVNAVVADPNAVLVNRVTSSSVGSTCPEGSNAGVCGTSTIIDASTLELRDLTTSFTLTGVPGSTVSLNNAAVGTVITNSLGGYTVSVKVVSEALTGQQSSDTIPVGNLAVRENRAGPYEVFRPNTAITVYSQDHASAPAGDAVSTDYQVQIPDVTSGTYSITVEYVVTPQ